MSFVITQSPARSPTAQAANAPFRMTFDTLMTVETTTSPNRVLVPNADTQQVMAETEAGINVVNCATLEDLFEQLDS